ncbi:MAG: hypothetical protein H6922_06405 [Pseudomonadaceae bacterium]|nr:hypothetical protein [Pseudomonadaceae bacterium]
MKCLFFVLAFTLSAATATAQTLTKLSDAHFGTIEFASNPLSGNIVMHGTGVITYPANASGSGVGTAGAVRMNGTSGTNASIRCKKNVILQLARNNKFNLDVRLSVATAQTFANSTACNGLNKAILTRTLNGTTADTIYAAITIPTSGANVTHGNYSTVNSGKPMVIRVIFN